MVSVELKSSSAVVEAGISAISSGRKSVNKSDFIGAIKKVEDNRKGPTETNSEGDIRISKIS